MSAIRLHRFITTLPAFAALAACSSVGGGAPGPVAEATADASSGLPDGPVTAEQVQRGRLLVINHECGGCHGGGDNPSSSGWLRGDADGPFTIGEARFWPRNLTPDAETGLGGVSERQVFNALRYGLRPTTSPDVEVTSHVPGEGNHPAEPDYLGFMPWPWYRYMPDQDLWDIAAYIVNGLKPVRNEVPDSDPMPEEMLATVGSPVLPPFPAAGEELRAPDRLEEIMRGRQLVAGALCSACHGNAIQPDQDGWLVGMTQPDGAFQIGDCADPEGPDCFTTRPRNLTPHNTTGIGRFTERQIFNALRFGLRPGETPDVEITSMTPGEGNFPENPKYLAPPMPWPAFRHMPDQDLRDIAAYLKHGVKPVENRVEDSEGPPDFWAGMVAQLGAYPPVPFPTANERALDEGG
jgi:mono/diheme cytochrome c family protein